MAPTPVWTSSYYELWIIVTFEGIMVPFKTHLLPGTVPGHKSL